MSDPFVTPQQCNPNVQRVKPYWVVSDTDRETMKMRRRAATAEDIPRESSGYTANDYRMKCYTLRYFV